jgi:ion channel-forming bestrophin family protein
VVNNSRTLARQALTLVDRPKPEVAEPGCEVALVELQIAWVHALRCHLRKQNPFPELQSLLPAEVVEGLRIERNVPAAMLLLMGRVARKLFEHGRLDSIRLTAIDSTLTDLCNVQGACERIKNTPLPRQYEVFPRWLVAMYCVMLPIGLVGDLGLLTPAVSSLVSFIFVTLETIGRDLESPFENTVHDTPLTALSNAIELNLKQHLGETDLPTEVRPVHGFVY